MNAIKTLNQIKEIARNNQSREEVHKTRTVKSLKVGECYRQGDIYVFKVSDNHPVGDELKRHQIADGTSLGARHMLISLSERMPSLFKDGKPDQGFKIYEGKEHPCEVSELHRKANCLGYAFDVLNTGVINTHPEHDNFKFEQCGRFQVMHQVDMMTLKRVAD